jgi:hypothetical protein
LGSETILGGECWEQVEMSDWADKEVKVQVKFNLEQVTKAQK